MRRADGFSWTRLVIGLTILAGGVILILDAVDRLDADDYLIYWPLALVAIGLPKVLGPRLQERVIGGVLMLAGVWILAFNLEWTDFEPWELFWPLILILLGTFLVLGALRRRAASGPADAWVTGVALLGAAERKTTSEDFRGADLTAIMGGCELDLRQAKISEGVPVIQVLAFWGGIEIRLPQDWRIDYGVLPILGGYGDETEQSVRPDSPTVKIKGAVIMGGIDIKN